MKKELEEMKKKFIRQRKEEACGRSKSSTEEYKRVRKIIKLKEILEEMEEIIKLKEMEEKIIGLEVELKTMKEKAKKPDITWAGEYNIIRKMGRVREKLRRTRNELERLRKKFKIMDDEKKEPNEFVEPWYNKV